MNIPCWRQFYVKFTFICFTFICFQPQLQCNFQQNVFLVWIYTIANPKGLLSEISLYWKNLWTCYIPVVHSICYGDLFFLNFLFVNLFVVLMCTVWTKVLRTDKSCRLFLWSREGWMWLCKPTYPCYIWPILLIPNYFHSYPDQPYFLLEIFVVWICCL